MTDIERRFPHSLRNFLTEFSYPSDRTQRFMNYGDAPQPVFIQQGENREVLDSQLFQQLVQEVER